MYLYNSLPSFCYSKKHPYECCCWKNFAHSSWHVYFFSDKMWLIAILLQKTEPCRKKQTQAMRLTQLLKSVYVWLFFSSRESKDTSESSARNEYDTVWKPFIFFFVLSIMLPLEKLVLFGETFFFRVTLKVALSIRRWH